MSVNCRNVVYTIGLIALCFVGIPINLNNDDVIEQEFVKFIQLHNKSYVNQPEEYASRLAYFKVSQVSLFTQSYPYYYIRYLIFEKYFIIYIIRPAIAEHQLTILFIQTKPVMLFLE